MSFENILSRTNCCLGGRGGFFDLCWFTDQTKYGRPLAERTQLHHGAMDHDPHGHRQHRDIAELMTAGLHAERALDAADQLRLEQMLQENAWAAFHN